MAGWDLSAFPGLSTSRLSFSKSEDVNAVLILDQSLIVFMYVRTGSKTSHLVAQPDVNHSSWDPEPFTLGTGPFPVNGNWMFCFIT